MPLETVKLQSLCTTVGTQMRIALDAKAAEDYGALLQEGIQRDRSDPIQVVELVEEEAGMPVGTQILAHGFHWIKGAIAIGVEELEANVVEGTIQTARSIAIRSNNDPRGVRQSREDVRKKIFAALQHPDFRNLSSRELQEALGNCTTHVTVLACKKELAELEAEAAAIVRGEKAPEARPQIEPLGAGGGEGEGDGEESPWPTDGEEGAAPATDSARPLPPISKRDLIEVLLSYAVFTNKEIELNFPMETGGSVVVTAVWRKAEEMA